MKKTFSLFLILLLIVLFPILSGCDLEDQQKKVDESMVCLDQVFVHGENAFLYLDAGSFSYGGNWLTHFTLKTIETEQETTAAEDTLQEKDKIIPVICGNKANQGLLLWQLDSGSYNFWLDEQQIYAEDMIPLEGYTILRDGVRKYWCFSTDPQSKAVTLTIEEVSSLPDGYCDIFIDVGHGGNDTGARTYRYIEAEENLKAALYMADQLEAQGFVVQLSRYDQAIPGGDAAENNPYISEARVDSIYQSHASYLLSNHLNGGDGYDSGYQLYTSVHTDNSWAADIAGEFSSLGWSANNGSYGLIENGTYKRWARDNYHSDRDYYFILRETGGYSLAPYRYLVHNNKTADMIRRGPEGILLEYLFLDNSSDMVYWQANYPALVDAVLTGSYQYWQLSE